VILSFNDDVFTETVTLFGLRKGREYDKDRRIY